ncbi:branched-chain amino acid ABC transporter permease [Paraburkholderia ginsengisoli]|uniref:Branched-chain amino acid ABC transporter permease n=1 Tax=Paraburkholderia ginsengisoli TaxID=311231 RepID=A0A7T4N7V5_9BURK|nr:branched-chain amino acid ABC transporter permease [Paraburkholderia ginsengisoli]QQC66871.1 branched-chain amino acid ABC transporter permease [Paraburkholderia ginsengisoli]
MTDLILQSLYSGVLVGGAYALVALGLALVFGAMRIINLAHGELVLLSAYIAYSFETRLGINPVFAIPAAIPVVCAAAGAAWFLVSKIARDRELNSLILTYGLGIILTNGVLLIWGADVRSTNSAWLQDSVMLGNVLSMRSELLSFGISVVLMGALWWWLSHSWYGRAVRAISSNRDAARLMGINPKKTELVSFLVAGVLASCAGVAMYASSAIQPSIGEAMTVKAFIITVLAGVGSIPGVLLGAMLLGITEALTVTLYSSALQELAGMLLFLLVLYVLPNGLFGVAWRRG